MKLKVIALMLLVSLALCFVVSCTEDQIASSVAGEDELPPGYQIMAEVSTPSRDPTLIC